MMQLLPQEHHVAYFANCHFCYFANGLTVNSMKTMCYMLRNHYFCIPVVVIQLAQLKLALFQTFFPISGCLLRSLIKIRLRFTQKQ